jgi:flagellar hook-associated protein 3 FlgL
VTYTKTGFDADDLRPEHYFTCTRVVDEGKDTEKTYNYTESDQQIKYLVNYNQQMTVNTQAKDCYTHDMGRDVDELVDIVNDVIAAEDVMNEFKSKMDAAVEGTSDYTTYKGLYENAQVEYELRSKIMQTTFASAETKFQDYGDKFSNMATDAGSREQRVELIKNRLENQQADVEELQSSNIDVDLSEIIVRFTSALDVYQAALSATSKSITQTLLDYL